MLGECLYYVCKQRVCYENMDIYNSIILANSISNYPRTSNSELPPGLAAHLFYQTPFFPKRKRETMCCLTAINNP